MNKIIVAFSAVGLGVVLLAQPALALDMEYYTYGGFNPVVQAFVKIALIFSDTAYQGLLFVATALGVVAGAGAWIIRATMGAKIVPLVWTVPVIGGAVVYLALFVPTGNITVYDPTLNRFEIVGDVPDAIVFTAGVLNKVEKGLVDIIDTAAAPNAEYIANAGALGFKALESVKGSSPVDSHVRSSMIRYIRDCVTFELMRPGTTLSLDELRNTTTDFLDQLGQAVNPAVYTVYYDAAHPEGTNVTCTESWNQLQPIYANPGNYDDAIRKVCSKAHFDPDETLEMDACRSLITGTLEFTTGEAVSPERIIQQRQIAEMLYNFYFQDDFEASIQVEANRKVTAIGLGVGITMNEWIPIIRAIMTAVAIGILPFLVLFLPTPIFGKAVSVMVGFFIFLSTWGITDAAIHGAAMDYAAYSFEDMRQSNLGVYAMLAFPNLALKTMGMFGVIRSAGLMLATIFSMMLVKFGGTALAHLATNLSSVARGVGSQAGQLATPEGNAAALSQQAKTAGLLDHMNEQSFTNQAAAQAFGMHKAIGGYHAAMNTRNTLQDSGQIPMGTSNADMATMMASAKTSVGTGSGPVEVSTTPSGGATMMKGQTVNSDGSTTVMTTGADGAGRAEDTMAQGRASYAVDSAGNQSLNQASVNGLNPVAVSEMAQSQKVTAASHSLGGSTNWNMLAQQMQKDSQTSSESQTYSDRLDNSLRENWQRSFKDSSSFVHLLDQTTRTQFMGAANVGGGISDVRLGANGQLSVVGMDGEKVSFNVSEDTAEAFTREQAKVRSLALQETFGSSQGLDYMQNMARQIGATEAYSYLDDARYMSNYSESSGADLTTALVRDYAVERYGSDSPENIRRAIGDFNDFLVYQGSQGVQNMNNIVNGFVSGNGYGWGNTSGAVNSAIDSTRARVQGDDIFRGAVGQAAGRAAASAGGVNQGSFTSPGGRAAPMQEPDAGAVLPDATGLRDVNRREESGDGRIQTTATGMAGEGVGKVFDGVTDSQGNRPTSEGYFNDPPSASDGVNIAGPGPVSNDASSALGGKK